MAVRRDYKPADPRQQRKKNQQSRIRILGWTVVGMTLGGTIASGIAWFKGREPTPVAALAPQAAAPMAKPATQDARAVRQPPAAPLEPPPKPKFDFYSVLKERQVTISPDEIRRRDQRIFDQPPAAQRQQSQAQSRAAQPGAAPQAKHGYLVQAGAFPNPTQAERIRASMGLLGIGARVEQGTLPDGTTVYRVRTGPFNDPTQAQAVRQRLQDANIPAISIKVD